MSPVAADRSRLGVSSRAIALAGSYCFGIFLALFPFRCVVILYSRNDIMATADPKKVYMSVGRGIERKKSKSKSKAIKETPVVLGPECRIFKYLITSTTLSELPSQLEPRECLSCTNP